MNPDSTFAVTQTCPKDGVHLWIVFAGRKAAESVRTLRAVQRGAPGRCEAGFKTSRQRHPPVSSAGQRPDRMANPLARHTPT